MIPPFFSGQTFIPARRDFFLLCSRLSPQAKDLFWKLSALRTVQYLDPQKQIGRTFQGKTACFPLWRLAKARSLRQSPFSAKRRTRPFAFHRGREPKSAVFGSLRIIFPARRDFLFPTKRKFLFRPDAISFCFIGRLSPQAKVLICILSAKRTVR